MYNAKPKKSESKRHHWWPESVSKHWINKDGGIARLTVDGKQIPLTPKNIGVIGKGHSMEFGISPGEATPWDNNFESDFQEPDDSFPSVIEWASGLNFNPSEVLPNRKRFLAQPIGDEIFLRAIKAITSLALRTPMTRERCVSAAEHFRGPLPERERNLLISSNLRQTYRLAMESLSARGKLAVIYSPQQEFIYGDGFYHNMASISTSQHLPKILAPLTPKISILYGRAMSYSVEPRLVTLVLRKDEAVSLNKVVQVYSKNELFFRNDKPEITEDFLKNKHLVFSDSRNVVEQIFHDIPGVPPRDDSLDFLQDFINRN